MAGRLRRMSELTLYVDSNFVSPWALTAFVALEEKGLPYRLETKVLSKRETFAADYRAPNHKVPALKQGDFWLGESVAIAEYLAEAFPFPSHPRLFPEDLQARARCRELQQWLRTDFQPIREARPTTTLWFARASGPLPQAAEASLARLVEAVEPLLAHGRPTLFAEFCIADVDLGLMLQRLNLNGTALPKTLSAYAEAVWARPSVARWNALPRAATPE